MCRLPYANVMKSAEMLGDLDERIRVGHIDVPGFWVDVRTNTSMTSDDVISRSGMRPRDGSVVNCYLANDGAIVTEDINPGQTILVGTNPPDLRVPINMRISPLEHSFYVKWERRVGDSGASVGSGHLADGCTLWVPCDEGRAIGSIRSAVELTREVNSNGKMHAQGYTYRNTGNPYIPGDLARITTSGSESFRLYDPETGELSIPVKIIDNNKSRDVKRMSFREAKHKEIDFGARFLWGIRVLSWDEERRRVLAFVEEDLTW